MKGLKGFQTIEVSISAGCAACGALALLPPGTALLYPQGVEVVVKLLKHTFRNSKTNRCRISQIHHKDSPTKWPPLLSTKTQFTSRRISRKALLATSPTSCKVGLFILYGRAFGGFKLIVNSAPLRFLYRLPLCNHTIGRHSSSSSIRPLPD